MTFQTSDFGSATAASNLRSLCDAFADIFVISLASRPDRRARIAKDLRRLGLSPESLGITWFDGMVFDAPAGFPSIGVRGCFNSHLALMRKCAEMGRPMLVMEDDVDFSVPALAAFTGLAEAISREEWDILYFGYLEPDAPEETGLVPFDGWTIGGHFYAVKPAFASAIADFMESCLTRPSGHPEGGPMYRDAAFAFFRETRPQWRTLLASPSLAGQFSSRSDLAASPAFYDRIGLLRPVASWVREVRARLGIAPQRASLVVSET